jgi:hypothetical protein
MAELRADRHFVDFHGTVVFQGEVLDPKYARPDFYARELPSPPIVSYLTELSKEHPDNLPQLGFQEWYFKIATQKSLLDSINYNANLISGNRDRVVVDQTEAFRILRDTAPGNYHRMASRYYIPPWVIPYLTDLQTDGYLITLLSGTTWEDRRPLIEKMTENPKGERTFELFDKDISCILRPIWLTTSDHKAISFAIPKLGLTGGPRGVVTALDDDPAINIGGQPWVDRMYSPLKRADAETKLRERGLWHPRMVQQAKEIHWEATPETIKNELVLPKNLAKSGAC